MNSEFDKKWYPDLPKLKWVFNVRNDNALGRKSAPFYPSSWFQQYYNDGKGDIIDIFKEDFPYLNKETDIPIYAVTKSFAQANNVHQYL